MKTIRKHKSWLLILLCSSIFALPLLTLNGAFDTFMHAPGSNIIVGETQDVDAAKLKAFEILSFHLGAENSISIGSVSSGGGAGKATFKEMTITRRVDTASTGFFQLLTTGQHLDEMVCYMRRSGSLVGKSTPSFLKFTFRFVMIQDVSWSGSDGDDIVEEVVVLQFGAMEIEYTKQNADGSYASPKSAQWSRVLNNATLDVE